MSQAKERLDKHMVEVVGMGEMDLGVTEFFCELPGILLVFILAAFYMLSAESLYKAGAVIMLVGMGMHAMLPAAKVLTTLAICMYSLGEHIQLGGQDDDFHRCFHQPCNHYCYCTVRRLDLADAGHGAVVHRFCGAGSVQQCLCCVDQAEKKSLNYL